jgi:TetR/AcrR family transcriptional regulator
MIDISFTPIGEILMSGLKTLKSVDQTKGLEIPSSRKSILASARALFAQKGYSGTSTQEIALKARVNKRLIFYYFESKEKLYMATLQDFFAQVERFLQKFEVREQDLSDRWLALLRFSDNIISFVSQQREPVMILMREIMDEGPLLDEITEFYIRPTFSAAENYLRQVMGEDGNAQGRGIHHLLLSLGGANLLYFIALPLLTRIWDIDPNAPEILEERKQALRRFILRSL